jgi:16S rRNA (guanine(1405)-N(7))-methyltransferase
VTNNQDIIEELILEESAAIARRYRIDQDQAAERLRSEFDHNPKVKEMTAKASGTAAVRRTRRYRDIVTRIRKDIYYDLRRYVKAEDDLKQAVALLEEVAPNAPPDEIRNLAQRIVSSHESTRERMDELETFNASILEFLGDAQTIVDVGCGVYPLVFPIQKGQSLLALDQDEMAIRAVRAWAQIRIDDHVEAIRWSLEAGWDSVSPLERDSTFDAALMLKLVPVVQRQNRELLGLLARIAAKRWIVTGSRIALAKKQNIERRERRALLNFARMANRRVVGEFSIETEFGLILDEIVT